MEAGVPNSEPGGAAGLYAKAKRPDLQPADGAIIQVRGEATRRLSQGARESRRARPGLT